MLFAWVAIKVKPTLAKQTVSSKYIISNERNTKAVFYFFAALSFAPPFDITSEQIMPVLIGRVLKLLPRVELIRILKSATSC